MKPRIPLHFREFSGDEILHRARTFCAHLTDRRSVRDFSDRPIPPGVLEECLRAAITAPNGANLQPWHFTVISSPEVKKTIRIAAEAEEVEFYRKRATEDWLETLAPIGTDAHKPFLETAPALIAIFQKSSVELPDGDQSKTYYPKESTGIATGFLISALHHAGLATLTHTPSPMKFMNEILHRPSSEKPFLLLVVGFPAENCTVPDLERRGLEEMVDFL
ncbi:nitroreductase family protein [Verrucomicrobiaceae bacterium 227]